MAIPYSTHAIAETDIDLKITDETEDDSVTNEEVGDAINKTNAMLDAIASTAPDGTMTYRAPNSRTDANGWWILLKEAMEDTTDDVTVRLPAVLIQPSDNDTITITAARMRIIGGGATVKRSATTPVGELITMNASTIPDQLKIADNAGNYYEWVGKDSISVTGMYDASKDFITMQAAIDSLKARGGTIYAHGQFILNERLYFSNYDLQAAAPAISLIGDGPRKTHFDLVDIVSGETPYGGFQWFGNNKSNKEVQALIDDADTFTGAPVNPGVPFQNEFASTAHGLQIGDWVMIWSTDYADRLPVRHNDSNKPNLQHNPGELVRVEAVPDADTFITGHVVVDAMTTCYMRKQQPIADWKASGFSILCKHKSNTFRIYEARDFEVSNIEYLQDPNDIVNTGMNLGLRLRMCANFNIHDCVFPTATAVGHEAGSCLMLQFMNTSGTVKDMVSNTVHHHVDTAAMLITGVVDPDAPVTDPEYPAGGQFDTRVGTQRDIVIDNWKGRHYFLGEGNREAFTTHESGWGISFVNCMVNCGNSASGFGTRSRNTRFENCVAVNEFQTGTALAIGFLLNGQGHKVIDCLAINFNKGIEFNKSDVSLCCDNSAQFSTFTNCERGAYIGSDDATIENCVFTQATDIQKKSATTLSHIQVYDGALGHQIRNNSFTRGTNVSAIHVENYVPGRYGTLLEFSGNQLRLYGSRDGGSEAFYSGAAANTPVVHDPAFAAEWQDDNYLRQAALYGSAMIQEQGQPGIPDPNTSSYAGVDWVLNGVVTFRKHDFTACLLSKRNDQGTSSNWLLAGLDTGQWSTEIDRTSRPFVGLAGPEVGPVYEFQLAHTVATNTLTLTVNGVTSDPLTPVTPVNSNADFVVGSSYTGTTFLHNGDLGVVFESPPATEVITWPQTTAEQSITAASDTIAPTADIVTLNPDANYDLTSNPQIADGTLNQVLILDVLEGNAFTVTLDNGDGIQLEPPAVPLVLGTARVTSLTLKFNGTIWIELSHTGS